ncbi:MAG: ATP-binding sensor histidine kinase [Polyangiaceae bacterium]
MGALPAYTVTETLSRSARGSLLRAVRVADGRRVLLKVLEPQRTRPRDLSRLKHELSLGGPFAGGPVVEPLALDTYEGKPALVLEDFGGAALDTLLGAPLPIERFLRLAIGITSAVAELHARGVVHKDLKPQNILVDEARGEVKLTELGIASRLAREPSPSQGLIEGSLPYLSPEQTGRMNRSIDSRSDLYSLGVTFYQMLAGRLPFEASDPPEWIHCHVARPPRPLGDVRPSVPRVISDIVMRLLAKMAEDRYQTARGLLRDLSRAFAGLSPDGTIEAFPLGQGDLSDRFEIAQGLTGREEELAVLRGAFERASQGGRSELVLVSGEPGVGKTSLVRELYRVVVRERGLFGAGKFDQYKRDIPYATFADAFGQIVLTILAESEARVGAIRVTLQRALGKNARVIADVVPEVERLLGPQPPVVPLPPIEAQNRFHLAFRHFASALAGPDRPLVVFLDDLQWVDPGSLRLLRELIESQESHHLLVLGAYRDAEVGDAHPLLGMMEGLRRAGGSARLLTLAPLGARDLGRILAGALRSTEERAAPLARIVHQKTGGNPFYAVQFLQTLHEEGLIKLDRARGEWTWDARRIHDKGFTENVVDFMVRKIVRLPPETQRALKIAACAGGKSSLHKLALVAGESDEEIEHDLWPAVREGLIFCREDTCTFLHDRIQQGAYALLDEATRRAIHLQIGRILMTNLPPDVLSERLFDVAGHLANGRSLVTDPAERARVGALFVRAGKKAKASAAYTSARSFFGIAAEMLAEDAWRSRYAEAFAIHLEHAECATLSGAFEEASDLFELCLSRAATRFDKATVYERRLRLYPMEGHFDRSLALALEALALFGETFPDDGPALEDATREEAERVRACLSVRDAAALVDLPETTDPEVRALIGLLAHAAPSAYIGPRPALFPLIILRIVRISIERGHTRESCMGFSCYGFLLVSRYGDPESGRAVSEMSIRLGERLGDAAGRGRALHLHGDHILFWSRPFAEVFPVLEDGFASCIETGDLAYGGYIAFEIPWQAFERGDALDDVAAFSQRFLAFAQESKNAAVHATIRMEQQLVACLQGRTRAPSSFEDPSFDEAATLAVIEGAAFMPGVVFYHTMKLLSAYLMSDARGAARHAEEARKTLSAAMAMPIETTFHFIDALRLCRAYADATEEERPGVLAAIEEHERLLVGWDRGCPANFAAKRALVAAERARVTGDLLGAEQRYEEALFAAREGAFPHWEAISAELAGRFYLGRGMEIAATAYLREAHGAYRRWGAAAKVRSLEQRYPNLSDEPSAGPTATIVAAAEQLDFLSMAKASQTISREIVQDDLARILLSVALEQGGAERAILLLCREGKLTVEAEASIGDGGPVSSVLLSVPLDAYPRAPASLIQFVARTRQRVILGDAAAAAGQFSGDEYFSYSNETGRPRSAPRAVLCLPIPRQREVLGILYLENSLLAHAFTPDRLVALELLATQAAISLQNARLLAEERAAREAAEEAERAAREAVRARDEFLTVASHELNTPVTSLMLALHSLSRAAEPEKTLDAASIQRLVGLAARQGERLTKLVSDLLDVSRIEAGKRELSRTRFDLQALAREVAERLSPLAARAACSVTVAPGPEVMGSWDRSRIDRVLVNLLSNAIKFGAGKPIDISVIADGDVARVLVRDRGIGIDPRMRARIWGRFERAVSERNYGGLGLGLYISKRIVEEHGGSIDCESEPGRGSVFAVELPLV